MRQRQGKMLKVLLVLLAVAGMATLSAQGWAQSANDICLQVKAAFGGGDWEKPILTQDPDNDGFINYWECYGTAVGPYARLDWPGYDPNNPTSLNPVQANLFLIINPLNQGSEFPPAAEYESVLLKHLIRNKGEKGLGIVPLFTNDAAVGVPDPDDPMDRVITLDTTIPCGNGQIQSRLTKAMRISEETDYYQDIFFWGRCKQGPVTWKDNCVVFTGAIRAAIENKCAGYPDDCRAILSDGSVITNSDGMVMEAIAKVIAHEGGHSLNLSTHCDNKTGICHNKGGGEVMEAFALFKRGTWKLGTDFLDANIDGYMTHELYQ